MNRPLLWVALAIAAGIGLAAFGAGGLGLVLLLSLGGLGTTFFAVRSYVLQPVGIFLLFAAVGALSWTVSHAGPSGDPLCRASRSAGDAPWELEGRVRAVQLPRADPEPSQTFVLDVRRARAAGSEWPLSGRVQVQWANPDRAVFADEYVRVTGRLTPDLGEVNPGVSGYEDYLRRRGIHSRLRARGPDAVDRLEPARLWHPAHWASRLRAAEADRLARALPPRALPFVLTVWLGDSYASPEGSYRAYVASGTAHILSVSGLHMGIVYLSAALLLRPLAKRRRLRAGLILGVVWVFALTAGASVACVRAAAMLSIYLAAELFEREPDAPSALGLSAAIFLLASPDLLFDAGFQLSYLSVASILLYAEPTGECLARLPHYLRGSLAMSLSAQVLPLPAAATAFHVLPLAAPVANFAVVPLLGVALWLAFLTLAAGLLPADFSALFGHALAPVVYLIEAVAGGVAAIRGTHVSLTTPTVPAVAAYLGAAAALWVGLRRQQRRGAVVTAAALLVLAAALWRPWHQAAELVFLDVGPGDSAFLRTTGGSTVLIDGGDRVDASGEERVVVPFLRSNRVSRLDYVVATHFDADHLTGLRSVVAGVRVGTVLLPLRDAPDGAEKSFLALCERRHVPVRRLCRGDTVSLSGGTLTVLHPSPDGPDRLSSNEGSLVLRLEWAGPSVLFAGDVEAEGEAAVARTTCQADILKVPHHGSNTSSTEPFLAAVGPAEAVVSTGVLRGRELARPEVLARYERRGIRVWRTDRLGGIRIVPAAGGYRVESARLARGYPVPEPSNAPRRDAS